MSLNSIKSETTPVSDAIRAYLSVINLVNPSHPQTTPEIFSADPWLLTRINLAMSIKRKKDRTSPTSSTTNRQNEVWLKLVRPTIELPFREGRRVRIKYLDDRTIVFCWDAEVIKIVGTDNSYVAVSIRSDGLTLQRRQSYRVCAQIPFSFTVIDAAETRLIGETVLDSETQNIGAGGLKFDTHFQLQVGDTLALNLELPASRIRNMAGWVVRSEPVACGGKSLYSVALKFLQLEEREQHKLLQFLQSHF